MEAEWTLTALGREMQERTKVWQMTPRPWDPDLLWHEPFFGGMSLSLPFDGNIRHFNVDVILRYRPEG